ncbi:GL18411 [Drosophila persimilis]|uniref:GL18411 n=1 Tax=Drosophila persimilis TaxID=7234 RepID=B4HA80_DROPE|nr:GL18411 [Drosophila persimilis]
MSIITAAGVQRCPIDKRHHGCWQAMSANSEMFALHTRRIRIHAGMVFLHFMAAGNHRHTNLAESRVIWRPSAIAPSTLHCVVQCPHFLPHQSHERIQR